MFDPVFIAAGAPANLRLWQTVLRCGPREILFRVRRLRRHSIRRADGTLAGSARTNPTRTPVGLSTDWFTAEAVPPQLYFLVSAVFHYLGPAFAVLLFAALAPLGVAWLRIVSAAVVFAVWRRPWRLLPRLGTEQRWLIVALGVVLGAMNSVFYEAIARIPLGTVGAIEFLGPIALAALGMRTRRNLVALGLAVAGVAVLTDVRIAGQPLAYVFAFGNCALFVVYVVLGHRVANSLEDSRAPTSRLARSRSDGGASGVDRTRAGDAGGDGGGAAAGVRRCVAGVESIRRCWGRRSGWACAPR